MLGLVACGERVTQVSGIVAQASFETVACQPQEKTIKIRNNNTDSPQRVQGVLFELGTNPDRFFKIIEVRANNNVKQAVGDLVEEIQLPPGGILEVKVAYNPKRVTTGEETHATYLDIVLNGPKLGVMQIELLGKAPTALEGCGSTQGELQVFTVDHIKVTVKAASLPNGEFINEIPGSDIDKPFQFSVTDDGVATLTSADFPNFNITGDAIPGGKLQVTLPDDTEGTFDGADLIFDPIVLSGGGVINVEGTMTTETVDVQNDAGDISLSLTGSALADGKMKVVFAGKFPDNIPAPELEGGLVGAEFELSIQP